MQYSCGYFYNDNVSLDQAQIDKKNHILKKLNISENMNVLDIGCGWGGLAIHIAKMTGANVKGITLFGAHTTAYKVSIEREKFKAIQVSDLSKLSAEKVFEKLSSSI